MFTGTDQTDIRTKHKRLLSAEPRLSSAWRRNKNSWRALSCLIFLSFKFISENKIILFATLHENIRTGIWNRLQIIIQSTTGNKAKLTFQMNKLKHYHHVPPILFLPRSGQLVCQFSAGIDKAHLWFQFKTAVWGAKLAGAHLEPAKCLLHSGSMHSGDYCEAWQQSW